jgi:hypothetical protein
MVAAGAESTTDVPGTADAKMAGRERAIWRQCNQQPCH